MSVPGNRRNYGKRRREKTGELPGGRRFEMAVERHGDRCFYCPAAATTTDHHYPLFHPQGGDHEGNWVPACWPCNNVKDDRTPAEWDAYRATPEAQRELARLVDHPENAQLIELARERAERRKLNAAKRQRAAQGRGSSIGALVDASLLAGMTDLVARVEARCKCGLRPCPVGRGLVVIDHAKMAAERQAKQEQGMGVWMIWRRKDGSVREWSWRLPARLNRAASYVMAAMAFVLVALIAVQDGLAKAVVPAVLLVLMCVWDFGPQVRVFMSSGRGRQAPG